MGAAQNLRPWQAGQSGNPSGRPALPPELRAIKALSREECARVVARYWRMSCHEAAELTAGDAARELPMGDAAIIRILQEAITKGDFMRLSFLLDRALGKVQVIEADETDSKLAAMNDDELIKHVEEIIRKRKGAVA